MSSNVPLNLYRLGDIGEFKNGANFSQEDYGPGYQIVNVKQLYGGRYVELHGLESLGKDVLKRPEQLFLSPGDILFARSSVKRSGAGQCALVPEGVVNTIFSGFIIRYRLNDKAEVNSMYLSYLLQSPVYREVFPRIATGTAISNLSQEALKRVEVNLPDRAIQDQVADFLGILDDRISLLRETNATLEAIAQALFKSWFVDFYPVRAKMQGMMPEGMDEATAALFPDSFEETELGEVPRGWTVGKLSLLMCLHRGTVNPGLLPDTAFQHFSLPAFDEGQMPVVELGSAIRSNKTTVPVDAVLLSKLNPHIPRIWLPSNIGGNAVCSTEFLPLVPCGPGRTTFIYCMLAAPDFSRTLVQLVTGTSNSHQRIKPEGVLSLTSVIPSPDIIAAFDQIAGALFDMFKANREEMVSLANMRDSLLPRLISGQIRLPEAQNLAAGAI